MTRRAHLVSSLACWLLYLLGSVAWSQSIEFNRDIRPILAENCFYCHGPDAHDRQADLRLDLREEAIRSGAFQPGNAADSKLIERIFSVDPHEVMPPADSNKKLSDKQKALLKEWIDQGAPYQTHWAYQPPKRPESLAQASLDPSSSIDALVDELITSKGLTRAKRADPRTLIRRLYYDLIGLAPSPEQVAAFEADPSQKAYAELIESLLANPHFGERMAVDWLDVVRFADTIGYHSDNPRNVWPYRDYVIASFNTGKRFDRFTLEQIAGDLLPDSDQEALIGSAFNRLILSTEEGGAQPKDYEARMLADRVRAIGTVWLGQTTGCAQCHDHMYDPITSNVLYALGGFFADIQEPIVGAREEGLAIMDSTEKTRLSHLDDAVEKASQELKELDIKGSENSDSQAAKDRLEKARKERDAFYKSLPKCLITKSTPMKRTVRLLPRGNWMDETGPLIKPALPQYLMPSNANAVSSEQSTLENLTRLDLARWLVSPENPLTARVTMNRLWKHFFGFGLSKVLDDLGTQGEMPVNPKLLDFLACEFMDSGWDFKHMIRAIVLSNTYQQSCETDPTNIALDPLNRLTARQSPFRMDAEFIRDYALQSAGLLSTKIGGPSAKPYQPEGYWDALNFPTRSYAPDKGPNQYRRGLYTWWQRSYLHPSLLAFDAPSREECCAERTCSNIPQQALVLLNDPTYVEAARGLACLALEVENINSNQRLDWMFAQVLQRKPSPNEQTALLDLLNQQYTYYKEHPDAATKLNQTGIFQPTQSLDPLEQSAWTHIARVLLNLHETITRN
ncbi:MAG: PSD1 and planctomycete cytochrome C domain-containing protein [Planctomycetota bacterium]